MDHPSQCPLFRNVENSSDPSNSIDASLHTFLQGFVNIALDLDQDTDRSPISEQQSASLKEVPQEYIGDILLRILAGKSPVAALVAMKSRGVFAVVVPELDALSGIEERRDELVEGDKTYHHKDVFDHTMLVLDRVARQSENVWLRLAALLHDIAKPVTKSFQEGAGWTFHGHPELGARLAKRFFKRYAWPPEQREYVRKLILLHQRPMVLVREGVTDSAIRRIVTDAGADLDDLLLLCRADVTSKNPMLVKRYLGNYDELANKIRLVRDADELRNWQPPVSGEQIMQLCGLTPGVAVGVIKDRLEDAILNGVIPNEYDASVRFILEIKDGILRESAIKKTPGVRKRLRSLPDSLRE